MNEIIFLVEESPDGGYEAKALSRPIFTDADTLENSRTMIRDAVACHFDESIAQESFAFISCATKLLPRKYNASHPTRY